MSYINIETDILQISTSPICSLDFFQKKIYKLFDNKDDIIINGTFLYDVYNLNDINNIKHYENIDKLYIKIKNFSFNINIEKLEIENNDIDNNFLYESNISNKKNNFYKDFIILIDNPIIINVCYNIKTLTNHVSIFYCSTDDENGSKYSFLYNQKI